MELALLAAWSFSVAAIGGVAGLVLGNLRLPVVLLLATSPAAGAGANVAISGLAALAASSTHAAAGRLSWRLLATMGPPSLVGAVLGGLVSGALPERILLGTIAVVVLYGAVEVLRPPGRERRERGEPIASVIAIGLGVGLLGGIVGLILGSLRLPALIRWSGIPAATVVGTNAAVGVLVGAGGLVGHLSSGVDWDLLAAGGAAAVPGAYLGARLTGRLDDRALLRAVAAVLLISGVAMAGQAIGG